MAKALIESGWTSAAAVLVRSGRGAAARRGGVGDATRSATDVAGSLRHLVVYGVVAMAGVQLAFFNAVRTLDVGVALLLEFLAPGAARAVDRAAHPDAAGTRDAAGAGADVVGLVFVLDLAGAGSVDPFGVLWGLLAAVCVAAFFVLPSASTTTCRPSSWPRAAPWSGPS